MSRRVVQIVPAVQPREAVFDVAAALQRGLADCGVESRYLAARAPATLSAAFVSDESVLLHYVGYGYDPHGCPGWLVEGIEAARAAGRLKRLVTLFHEVYATGPPWRSSFWRSSAQKDLATRLLRASDAVVTSLHVYRDLIATLGSGIGAVVLPVPSTVGEPEAVPALRERPPRLVVFGGAGNRARAYHGLRSRLASACRELALREIVDVGWPFDVEEPVAGLPVKRLGPLEPADVSRVLLEARGGLVTYPAALLAKSTVHAAYCAHGVLPVRIGAGGPPAHERDHAPFWSTGLSTGEAQLDDLARRARDWYSTHRLSVQAARYAELLLGTPSL